MLSVALGIGLTRSDLGARIMPHGPLDITLDLPAGVVFVRDRLVLWTGPSARRRTRWALVGAMLDDHGNLHSQRSAQRRRLAIARSIAWNETVRSGLPLTAVAAQALVRGCAGRHGRGANRVSRCIARRSTGALPRLSAGRPGARDPRGSAGRDLPVRREPTPDRRTAATVLCGSQFTTQIGTAAISDRVSRAGQTSRSLAGARAFTGRWKKTPATDHNESVPRAS